MRKSGAYLLSAILLFISSQAYAADRITTADIIASSVAPQCMNYRVVGLCFWLVCSWKGCKVRTTVKVGHYNPDLVVSAQNGEKNNPWIEANLITGTASQTALSALIAGMGQGSIAGKLAGSNQSQRKQTKRNKALKFNASDAIGHPAASIPIPYRCPSQTVSLFPYFVSGADTVAWRFGIPEMLYPQALIPGYREVGTFPFYTWGSVYPRSGFINQTADAKAGAVIAQRAGDIVTRIAQPHVYTPVMSTGLNGGGISMKTWQPGALYEGNERTGKWQMLAPNMTRSCSVFGTNDLATFSGWDGGKQAKTGSYSWSLWRPYSCCKRLRGKFLYSIGSYP